MCLQVAFSVFKARQGALDVLEHPVRNIVYYSVVEIIPSSLVLFILRKLPPKRQHQYHAIS